MDYRQKLELKYDDLAIDFFQLIDRKRLLNCDYLNSMKKNKYFNLKKQDEMNINIPKVNTKRKPGFCDVLTTFLKIDDIDFVNKIDLMVNDIFKSFPNNIDCYRTPKSNLHISLVMLHDLRPIDMNNEVMLNSRIKKNNLNEIVDMLNTYPILQEIEKFELMLYGFRIISDGSILLLFIDNGYLLKLRNGIGSAISKFLQPKYLNYNKPFIHITVARIFEKIDFKTLLKLYEKQRKYFYIINQNIKLQIKKFYLGHEKKWMHSDVEIIAEFNLK